MIKRTLPLLNFALGKLNAYRALERVAAKVCEIEPAEQRPQKPAIFLPDQLDRATAPPPGGSTLKEEIALAHSTRQHNVPIIRYTLKNAIVHRCGLDVPGFAVRKTRLDDFHFLTGHARELDKAVYCMTNYANRYFSHWIHDACATALLQRPDESLLLDQRQDWSHATDYSSAIGFEREETDLFYVGEVAIYQDQGQGPSKRARYAEMRKRLRAEYPADADAPDAVFLRRGNTGVSRSIANEEEVISALVQRGFEVVDIATLNLRELFARLGKAKVAVSVEGSQISHLYFSAAAGASILALVPADRFTMLHTEYANAFDFRFGFTVIDPTEHGYRVDVRDLMLTLDQISTTGQNI